MGVITERQAPEESPEISAEPQKNGKADLKTKNSGKTGVP